jgi:hypothetical protein
MVLVGPETIVPQEQVVSLVSVKERADELECRYQVQHPLTGKVYQFGLTVPREVTPLSPVWAELDKVFAELFSRREYMLTYRDTAKTLILEAVYKLTKKPPPKKKPAAAKNEAEPPQE